LAEEAKGAREIRTWGSQNQTNSSTADNPDSADVPSEVREQHGKLAKNLAARAELKPFWMESKKDEAKREASRDCHSRHHPAIGYAENAFALSMILRPKQKGQLNVAN
jgi:hypothetical protein